MAGAESNRLTLLSMVVLLAVAQLGLSYYGEADSLRRAFYRARWFWLVWRCVLYGAVAVGLWKLYHTRKSVKTARRSLKRKRAGDGRLVAVSEWSVWAGGDGL
ncbi:hypothetical protein [Escherichia coli]|uniref:hypothetical protein n=1 Tax=Escherichia coli TaxID=562 RepID=UPI00203B9DAC|nr:hypothetical protein [Escherichia coli]